MNLVLVLNFLRDYLRIIRKHIVNDLRIIRNYFQSSLNDLSGIIRNYLNSSLKDKLVAYRDILRKIILMTKYHIFVNHQILIRFIFGPTIKLGTYEEVDPFCLSYPIIILNEKLLVELAHRKTERMESFLGEFLGFSYGESVKAFEIQLREILEGKDFPLETPLVPSNIKWYDKEDYLHANKIPESYWYRHTVLPSEFTLKLYKMWQQDPEFLNFVICYYFANIILEGQRFYVLFMTDTDRYNKYITFDITPFFIFQEQADSVANFLEKKVFKGTGSYEGEWGKALIEGLRNANLSKEVNEKTKKKTFDKFAIILLIISPFFGIIINFTLELFLFLITGRYGLMFIGIISFFIFKKIEKLIFSDNFLMDVKTILGEIINLIINNFKTVIFSIILAKISVFLPFIKKLSGKINFFF